MGIAAKFCTWLLGIASGVLIVHTYSDANAAWAQTQPSSEELVLQDISVRSLELSEIQVQGHRRISTEQILDHLASEKLRVGDVMLWPEDERVIRARERLLATGHFYRVSIKLRLSGEDKQQAILVVEVKEHSSIVITDVYLGTSKMTPFHGGLQLVVKNILGQPLHMGAGAVFGTLPVRIRNARRQQSGRLFLESPQLPHTKIGVNASFFVLSASEPDRVAGELSDPDPHLFQTVDYSRIGGIFGLTFPLASEITLAVDTRIEHIHAYAPTNPYPRSFDLVVGSHRLTSTRLGGVWDGRKDVNRVGSGGRAALDIQLSSPLLGSSYEYIKIVGGGAYTFRLPWRHWLTPSFVAGYIVGQAPRFEQFYAGDLSDWTPGRELGLLFSTRNPIDVFNTGIDTVPFGQSFFRCDLEYVWPLFTESRVRGIHAGHIFWSTGIFTIVDRNRDDLLWPIGFNANFGLRLDTFLGTVDLSIGNILRRTPL